MNNITKDTIILEAFFGKMIKDFDTYDISHYQTIVRYQRRRFSLDFLYKHRDWVSIEDVILHLGFSGSEILRVLGEDYPGVWDLISKCSPFDDGFMSEHRDYLNWELVFTRNAIPEEHLHKYEDEVPVSVLICKQKLSNEAIERIYLKEFPVNELLQKTTSECPDSISSNVFWTLVTLHQTLEEEFIEKHSKSLVWGNLRTNPDWSDDFLRQNKDKLDLLKIISSRNVPEDLIVELLEGGAFSGKIEPSYLQYFSDEFIVKHKDDICWAHFSRNKNLSVEQLIKYKEYVRDDFMLNNRHDERFFDKEFIGFCRNYQNELLMTLDGFDLDYLRENKDIVCWDYFDLDSILDKGEAFIRGLVDIQPSIMKRINLFNVVDVPLDSILDNIDDIDLRRVLLGNALNYDTKLELAKIINFRNKF